MKKARVLMWLAAVVVLAAVVAAAIPGSPLYLTNLLVPKAQYRGQPLGEWTKSLDDPDPETRKRAIFAVGSMGSDAGEAVPRLARILVEDPDRGDRIEASLALSKMDPASRAAVPELARALEDSEPYVRMNAARALSRLHTDARPAIPALTKALQDPANRTNLGSFLFTIQEQVALALGRASAGTADGVPDLLGALKGARNDLARVVFIRALGEVGPEAKPAAGELRWLTRDLSGLKLSYEGVAGGAAAYAKYRYAEVEQAAAEALQKIEGG